MHPFYALYSLLLKLYTHLPKQHKEKDNKSLRGTEEVCSQAANTGLTFKIDSDKAKLNNKQDHCL